MTEPLNRSPARADASAGKEECREDWAAALWCGADGAADIDRARLADTPGHLMRRAQQRAVEIHWQAVGEDGLLPPQFAVMLTVYQNPGLNQTALVNLTGIDRSTVADMIPRLIKKGYLERKRTPEDQRAKKLWITPEGEAMVRRNAEATFAAQSEILAPVPAGERKRFMDLLRLVADLPQDAGAERS